MIIVENTYNSHINIKSVVVIGHLSLTLRIEREREREREKCKYIHKKHRKLEILEIKKDYNKYSPCQ